MAEISASHWIVVSRKLAARPTQGHEYAFLRLLKNAFETLGCQVTLVNSVTQISDETWSLLESSNPGLFGRRLRSVVRSDARRIRQSIGQSADSELRFHFYEGGFYEFNLLAHLYASFPRARFTFNFNLTDPWHTLLLSNSNPFALILRGLVKEQSAMLSARVVFTTETSALSDLFRARLGVNTEVYPLYSTVSGISSSEKPIDFLAIVGSDSEAESASHLFTRLRSANSQLTMALSTRWGYQLQKAYERETRAAGVSLRTGLLPADEYLDLLSKSKLVLLPYFGEYYKWSSSARLLDAVASDCHVIVPKESTLSQAVAQNDWGFCVDGADWTDIERIVLSFTWNGLTTPPVNPTEAAIFLEDRVKALSGSSNEYDERYESRLRLNLLSYLNLGLDARSVMARYVDSRKNLANLSLRVRKILSNLTTLASKSE